MQVPFVDPHPEGPGDPALGSLLYGRLAAYSECAREEAAVLRSKPKLPFLVSDFL